MPHFIYKCVRKYFRIPKRHWNLLWFLYLLLLGLRQRLVLVFGFQYIIMRSAHHTSWMDRRIFTVIVQSRFSTTSRNLLSCFTTSLHLKYRIDIFYEKYYSFILLKRHMYFFIFTFPVLIIRMRLTVQEYFVVFWLGYLRHTWSEKCLHISIL